MSAYRIGGEFELSADMFLQPELHHKIDYNKKYQLFVDTGRSALFLALMAIMQQGGKREAWLPYFCCEAVELPFKILSFTINYYSLGMNLQSPVNLPACLNGGTFLFINYFGRENLAIAGWLKDRPGNDTGFIIEDNVSASLSTNCGKYGDFIINSYRKFLPQPDGAVLASDFPLTYQLSRADERFITQKSIAKLIRNHSDRTDDFLPLLSASEQQIDENIQPRQISFLSQYLFGRTDINKIALIRRNNWNYLRNELINKQWAAEKMIPLYDSLDDGEVPLGFPVILPDGLRNQCREYLMMQSIYCPIHWLIKKEKCLPGGRLDLELSCAILTLPIDQRLTIDALNYMVDKIALFLENKALMRK